MIVDRRAFILVSAPFVAVASALVSFPLLLRDSAPSPLPAVADDVKGVVFRVAGWHRCTEVAGEYSRTSSADLTASNMMDDEVFISINRSWRTAWR
jgi:hypothetical protein